MEYALLALLTSVGAPGLILLVAVASGYFTARRLGIPNFRPFRAGAPETRWKRFLVRTATVVTAFAICFALGALSAKASGTSHSTMVVDVVAGPARDAGLRDGDRIVSLDGKPYDDFHAFRTDIQASTGPRSVTFERNGERMTRVVDPMPERRIGVSARPNTRPATGAEAIERGFTLSVSPLYIFSAGEVEVTGPVGFVKEVARAPVSRVAVALYASALYTAYIWLGLVFLHLVDVLVVRFRRHGG